MAIAAYVVGPQDGSGAGLMAMARRIDFSVVLPYAGMLQAEHQLSRTPVCFFLFAAVPDVEALRGVAQSIRFSPRRNIRYAPLIYFSESPSSETIRRCVHMGFDDVVTMPFSRARLQARIDRQVGRPLTYFETSDYFGPDRRSPNPAARPNSETRIGGQHRRIEFVRNPMTGVHVLRDDFAQPEPRAAIPAAAAKMQRYK